MAKSDNHDGKIWCPGCKQFCSPHDIRGGGICYGCHLDSLIPGWYERAEKAEWDDIDKIKKATRHPKTGVPILDDTPHRLCADDLPIGFHIPRPKSF